MYVEARMISIINLIAKGQKIILPAFAPTEIGSVAVQLQLDFVFKAINNCVNKIFELCKEPCINANAKDELFIEAFVYFAI